MNRFLTLILLSLLIVSCNKSGKIIEHEKGFKYIPFRHSDYGLSPRVGDIVTVYFKVTTPNDSILQEENNLNLQVQQPQHQGGTIDEAFMFMNRGDSMAFFINGHNYYEYYMKETPPEFLAKNDLLRFDIVLHDVMSMKKFEELRRQRLSTGELEEKILLDNYLERVSKKRTEIDSMLFWIPEIDTKGRLIKENDIVEIHYIAYFIDGKIFSETYQSDSPFIFTVGDNRVIEGFNKVMPHIRNGSKGRIVIPSYLGYGSKGLPDLVPPFTTLIFDIEVVSVKTMP